MMKESMRAIENIGEFASIAFVIFICVYLFRFACMFWMRKDFIDKMSQLPLEDGTVATENNLDKKL